MFVQYKGAVVNLNNVTHFDLCMKENDYNISFEFIKSEVDCLTFEFDTLNEVIVSYYQILVELEMTGCRVIHLDPKMDLEEIKEDVKKIIGEWDE